MHDVRWPMSGRSGASRAEVLTVSPFRRKAAAVLALSAAATLALTATPVTAQNTLTLTNTAPAAVHAGGNLSYTITVTNHDVVPYAVYVTDTVPPGTELVLATVTEGDVEHDRATADWTVEVLPAETASMTMHVLVDIGVGAGTILTNTATAVIAGQTHQATAHTRVGTLPTTSPLPNTAMHKADDGILVAAGALAGLAATAMVLTRRSRLVSRQ
jgi:uncharacterized repeat protein (TIGR01451 family)